MKKQLMNEKVHPIEKANKTGKKKPNVFLIVLVPVLAVAVLIAAVSIIMKPFSDLRPTGSTAQTSLNQAGDLVIPISGLSSKATFYPVAVDGTKIEILAVVAPDKSIRTAFNTCQVCYDSGRGYYKQEGDVLVCQNCGNRFKVSPVELTKGGCNPVPIFDKDIEMDPSNLTISADYLKQYVKIFKNWKTV